jgi:hypothetical protein
VGLERGPLSFVSIIEELLGRKSSGSGLESREYGSRDPSRWPRGIFYPRKVALTSPTSGGLSVGIVRSRTRATEFVLFCLFVTSNHVGKAWDNGWFMDIFLDDGPSWLGPSCPCHLTM